MLWVLFLGLTVLAWGANDVFFKVLGNSMNYFLAVLIMGALQMIMFVPFIIYVYYSGELNYTIKGFFVSALMGILLGLGTIFFFYTFKYGAPLSVAMPVYGIGSLIIGVLAGVFIFKESLSLTVLAGLVLGTISIVLLTAK